MLLEVASMHRPDASFKDFEYQARNPLFVNQPVLIKGAWEGKDKVQVWAESGTSGVVGMTGQITLHI